MEGGRGWDKRSGRESLFSLFPNNRATLPLQLRLLTNLMDAPRTKIKIFILLILNTYDACLCVSARRRSWTWYDALQVSNQTLNVCMFQVCTYILVGRSALTSRDGNFIVHASPLFVLWLCADKWGIDRCSGARAPYVFDLILPRHGNRITIA
jgi:hypothetical protein